MQAHALSLQRCGGAKGHVRGRRGYMESCWNKTLSDHLAHGLCQPAALVAQPFRGCEEITSTQRSPRPQRRILRKDALRALRSLRSTYFFHRLFRAVNAADRQLRYGVRRRAARIFTNDRLRSSSSVRPLIAIASCSVMAPQLTAR